MVKIYVCNGFFDGSDSGSGCESALSLDTIYRFAKTYILQVAITYIFILQQPTFWFCNFLHFYFTTNRDDIYPARKDFEDDIEKGTLYLAYVEEFLVALYVISGECDEQYCNGLWKYDEKYAYILHRFCVSPLFQNQGIGKIVLHHVEEQIKKMGYNSVRLDCFTENPFAQRLYRNNGYESRGYADWRKGRFDLMEKKLSDYETV